MCVYVHVDSFEAIYFKSFATYWPKGTVILMSTFVWSSPFTSIRLPQWHRKRKGPFTQELNVKACGLPFQMWFFLNMWCSRWGSLGKFLEPSIYFPGSLGWKLTDFSQSSARKSCLTAMCTKSRDKLFCVYPSLCLLQEGISIYLNREFLNWEIKWKYGAKHCH